MKNYDKHTILRTHKNMDVDEFLHLIKEQVDKFNEDNNYYYSASSFVTYDRLPDADELYDNVVSFVAEGLGITPIEFEDIFRKKVLLQDLQSTTHIKGFLQSDGSMDMFLYKLTDGQTNLGGDDYRFDNLPIEDVIIKYGYGYLDSKYGRMWVEQSYKTTEELEKAIAIRISKLPENSWIFRDLNVHLEKSNIINVILKNYPFAINNIKTLLTKKQKEKYKAEIQAAKLGIL